MDGSLSRGGVASDGQRRALRRLVLALFETDRDTCPAGLEARGLLHLVREDTRVDLLASAKGQDFVDLFEVYISDLGLGSFVSSYVSAATLYTALSGNGSREVLRDELLRRIDDF